MRLTIVQYICTPKLEIKELGSRILLSFNTKNRHNYTKNRHNYAEKKGDQFVWSSPLSALPFQAVLCSCLQNSYTSVAWKHLWHPAPETE